MLSFDYDKDATPVALFEAYHAKRSKFVYLHKTQKQRKGDYTDDQLHEMMQLEYGNDKSRYKVNRDSLPMPDRSMVTTSMTKTKGTFIPFYPENKHCERNIYYIFGKSGSGKSHLAKRISKMYEKLEDYKVMLISPVKDDGFAGKHVDIDDLVEVVSDHREQKKAYEEAKIKFKYFKAKNDVDLDELMALELALNSLKPDADADKFKFQFTEKYTKMIKKHKTLFIYDDTEAHNDQAKMDFMKNSQLLTGRHNDISMVIINHQANSGAKTRHTINEANLFTFFAPMNRYTSYFLKTYLQFTGKQISKVKEYLRSSRYITVYKDLNLLLSENKVITI